MKYLNKVKKQIVYILIIVTLQMTGMQISYAAWESDYAVLKSGERSPIPKAYDVDRVIQDLGNEIGYLNRAEHLFIAPDGFLYVADTGNNRIVKLDKFGKGIKAITGPEDFPLSGPQGVFVDVSGSIFVADTGNNRVVHLSSEGDFIEEFTEPDSLLLDTSTYPFSPSKVVLDPIGNLNILSGNDFRGIISIDAWNEFRGYIGTNRVPFSLRNQIVRLFATPEQRQQLGRPIPPYFSNIVMDDEGYFYTSTVMTTIDQVKKMNILGVNIFTEGLFYGETHIPENPYILNQPRFLDLAVSENRIISVIDVNTRKIYQYDQEGNALCVFGGRGVGRGRFEYPVSIATDKSGYLYVLDRDRNNIQVFKRTPFMEMVHTAVDFYYEGKYEEALVPWARVLEIDSTYSLAHFHVGKALYKEENYRESMKAYTLAENKEGYSEAFAGYRNAIYREYFLLIVLIVVISAYAFVKFMFYLKKMAKKYMLEEMIN